MNLFILRPTEHTARVYVPMIIHVCMYVYLCTYVCIYVPMYCNISAFLHKSYIRTYVHTYVNAVLVHRYVCICPYILCTSTYYYIHNICTYIYKMYIRSTYICICVQISTYGIRISLYCTYCTCGTYIGTYSHIPLSQYGICVLHDM